MQPIVTLFCAFSRDDYTARWLKDLQEFQHDPERTNVVIIVDGDYIQTFQRLNNFFKGSKYRRFTIKMNSEHNPNGAKVAVRRNRIAFIHNQSKQYIKQYLSEYVLGLEDDTAFGGLSIEDLLQPYEREFDIGFVQGLQAGRWGIKYLGAWRTDSVQDPSKVYSITPDRYEGYTEIDGGGFYYYLTPTQLYCDHDYAWDGNEWGADVRYGFEVRKKGYRCLTHLESVVGHRTHFDEVIYPDGTITEVRYYQEGGKWLRKDTDKVSNYAKK